MRHPRYGILVAVVKALKIIVQVIWVVSLVTLGTAIGALHGWEHHGWLGATVLGTVGFCVGTFFAASPSLLLQLLGRGL